MKRKFKLFTSVASLCLAIALMVGGVFAAANPHVEVSGTVTFQATHVYATVELTDFEGAKNEIKFTAEDTDAVQALAAGDLVLDETNKTGSYAVKITNDFSAASGQAITVDFTQVPALSQQGYTFSVTSSDGTTVEVKDACIEIAATEYVTITVSVAVEPAQAAAGLDHHSLAMAFDLNRKTNA